MKTLSHPAETQQTATFISCGTKNLNISEALQTLSSRRVLEQIFRAPFRLYSGRSPALIRGQQVGGSQ